MKDGLYRVTLKIDGEAVTAEGRVSNGVFHGLGALSGVIGVLTVDLPRAANDQGPMEAPDHGQIDGMRWERVDLPHREAIPVEPPLHASLRATIAALREDAGDAMERGIDARNRARHLRSEAVTSASRMEAAAAALDDSVRRARTLVSQRRSAREAATA